MEYRIESAYTKGLLEQLVEHALRQEWEPIGGIAVFQDEKSIINFTQALIKRRRGVIPYGVTE